jgi:tRNA threonylcarbamoyladenosine biosynthesis protein TsaE
MTTNSIVLDTLDKTDKLGKLLGQLAIEGDVYCLDGDLGAGKTTLTQSIAKGLGVPSSYYVTSPSYNILHEYPGRIPLYHMDFYRLNIDQDIIDTGLDEFFYLSGLTVIEWSCKAQDILPENRLSLQLVMETSETRTAILEYSTSYWHERVNILVSACP